MIVTQIAPGKINLTLRVLGRRPDGYHELESLVAFATEGVADHVSLDTERALGLTIDGPFAAAIEGENLAIRAAELARQAEPSLRVGHITLTKNLPVAAGLGGGSADAAAVLRAIQHANPDPNSGATGGLASRDATAHFDRLDWLDLAKRLGADVPVCFIGASCAMHGIGHHTTAIHIPPFAAVLVNPQAPVPVDKTRRVFQALGARALGPQPPNVATTAGSMDLHGLINTMREHGNDLEPPAITVIPAIASVKRALLATNDCLHAQLSGAGPTCFGVYASPAIASDAQAAIASANPGWWVRATIIG